MEGIHVYGLHSRLLRTYPCIKDTCKKGGNPYMATDALHHNPHLSGDGLMICKSGKNLVLQLWWSMAWMEGIHMYVLHPMLVISFPCINKSCAMYGNPSMATGTSYHISHLHGDGLVVCRSC